jgi:hypothetical protein
MSRDFWLVVYRALLSVAAALAREHGLRYPPREKD